MKSIGGGRRKMIKRTYLLTILLIVCLLTGCGNKTEKMCRIEIRNENSTDVITLEQQSQADVDDFSMRTNGPNARTLMKNWFLNM